MDIIGHSMGGLIAWGLCQQNGYKENYMKGQIRRLIIIGTPHFGAGLAGILYRQKDNWYSYKDIPHTALYNSSYEDSDYKSFSTKRYLFAYTYR